MGLILDIDFFVSLFALLGALIIFVSEIILIVKKELEEYKEEFRKIAYFTFFIFILTSSLIKLSSYFVEYKLIHPLTDMLLLGSYFLGIVYLLYKVEVIEGRIVPSLRNELEFYLFIFIFIGAPLLSFFNFGLIKGEIFDKIISTPFLVAVVLFYLTWVKLIRK